MMSARSWARVRWSPPARARRAMSSIRAMTAAPVMVAMVTARVAVPSSSNLIRTSRPWCAALRSSSLLFSSSAWTRATSRFSAA